jgi:hypothetical protein
MERSQSSETSAYLSQIYKWSQPRGRITNIHRHKNRASQLQTLRKAETLGFDWESLMKLEFSSWWQNVQR